MAATVLLALVSLAACLLRKSAPYLLMGWLWYLGTLVPVIGLVQVGEQAMADRYTYVPLLGIFVMVVWGVGDLAARFRVPGAWLAGASLLLLALCAADTWRQIGYWHDTETLFERAIAVMPLNSRAHNILGVYLINLGRTAEGKQHLRAAVAIAPDFFPALNNLGGILAAENHDAEAAQCYREAMRIHPDSVIAHGNLGNLYARSGQLEEAVAQYVQVLRIVSANRQLDYKLGLDARRRLALLLPNSGTADEAMHRFTALAPQLKPEQLTRIRAFYAAVLARDPRFESARLAIARFNALER
jgi:tetratricopeptide (TPR) repeat protein